jgi:hypothetical protein
MHRTAKIRDRLIFISVSFASIVPHPMPESDRCWVLGVGGGRMNMTGFFERERESPVEWNRGEQMRDARCEM